MLDQFWKDPAANDPIQQRAQDPTRAFGNATAAPDPWTSTPKAASPAPGGAPAAPGGAPQPAMTAPAVNQALGVSPQLAAAPAPAAAPPPEWGSLVAAAPNDPTAHDALGRRVASYLTQAGHEVAWGEGGQLTVDGKPYEVAGSPGAQPAAGTAALDGPYVPPPPQPAPAPTDPGDPGTPGQSTVDPAPATNSQNTVLAPGEVPGWQHDAEGHWSPTDPTGWTHNPDGSWTQAPAAAAAGPSNGDYRGWFSQLVANLPPNQQSLLSLRGTLEQYGFHITPPNAAGEQTKIQLPDGTWVRVGFGEGQWTWVPQGGAGGDGGDQAANPAGAHLQQLWDRLSGLGGSPYTPTSNPDLDALMHSLLTHPESMDPHTVQMMEARDAEQQQEAAQGADQAIQRFGFAGGLTDSPWLASERASTARSADQGILSGRRNIEIQAAQTNQADRRAAAGLGINKQQLDQQLQIESARMGLSREQYINQLLAEIAHMEQGDQQFGADLGYRYATLNQHADDAYWND